MDRFGAVPGRFKIDPGPGSKRNLAGGGGRRFIKFVLIAGRLSGWLAGRLARCPLGTPCQSHLDFLSIPMGIPNQPHWESLSTPSSHCDENSQMHFLCLESCITILIALTSFWRIFDNFWVDLLVNFWSTFGRILVDFCKLFGRLLLTS